MKSLTNKWLNINYQIKKKHIFIKTYIIFAISVVKGRDTWKVFGFMLARVRASKIYAVLYDQTVEIKSQGERLHIPSDQGDSSFSNKPNARTIQAEPATTTAAKTGGTIRSILDLLNMWVGKQRISPGTSKGALTDASLSHPRENKDEGDIAHTNVISGQNEAIATVTVRRVVHVAA